MANSRRSTPTNTGEANDLSLAELVPVVNVPTVPEPSEVPALSSKEDSILMRLIKSGQLPGHVTTVESAFTIAKMGRELGFPIMQSFHFIIPIQGKLTLSAKAIGALLRKAGITLTTTEDAVYVYRDGSTAAYPKAGDEKPIDRRTTIVFKRKEEVETVSFTWNDAALQGLVGKPNYLKYPKEMLYARCLSKGGNRIGQDVLLGLYSTDEMYDVFSVENRMSEDNVRRDEAGNITEVRENITAHEVVL